MLALLVAIKGAVGALGLAGLALFWLVKALIGWKLLNWLRAKRSAKI